MSSPHNSGYRCHLPNGESYGDIGFEGWCLHLQVSNFGRARCRICSEVILPGEGVERKPKGGHPGFICLACVKEILTGHELGFIVTWLNNLEACILHHGRLSGQDLFDGIRRVSDATLVTFAFEISGERSEHKPRSRNNGNGQQSDDGAVHTGPGAG